MGYKMNISHGEQKSPLNRSCPSYPKAKVLPLVSKNAGWRP